MISEEAAVEQIKRLEGLHFFVSGLSAQFELVKALREVARDDSHAEQIVADWIRDHRESPTPADFYALIETPVRTKTLEELYG